MSAPPVQVTLSVILSAQLPDRSQVLRRLHVESQPTVFGGSQVSPRAASVTESPQKLGRQEEATQILPVPHGMLSASAAVEVHFLPPVTVAHVSLPLHGSLSSHSA